MSDTGAWQAAGLYDPDAPGAADRRALLEHLVGEGATVADMVEANRAGRLPALAGHLARRGAGPFHSPSELAAAGVARLETFAKIWQAAGLPAVPPDERGLNDQDVQAVRNFEGAVDLFGEDPLLQFTRAVGAALASIADASMAIFGLTVSDSLLEEGASELEYARALENGSRLLVDVVPQVMEALLGHHIDRAVDRYVAGGGDDVGAQLAYLAVGFLDLVESTPMIQELPPVEIASAIAGFEQRATEVVAAHGGRVVKTIGDEVMFVATTAADAAEIALTLEEFAAGHEALRGLRGGLAWGALVRGYGDYYGPVVNIAARAVKEARPGEVLAELELVGQVQAATALRVGVPREYELRGFAEPVVLWPVERTGP